MQLLEYLGLSLLYFYVINNCFAYFIFPFFFVTHTDTHIHTYKHKNIHIHNKCTQSYIFKSLEIIIFLKDFLKFIFRESGREGEIEGEKHQCVFASRASPTGDLDHSPGTCPNWELNQ